MTFDDFLPFVLPHVKGCPEQLALTHIGQALIQFCRESLVWREYQSAVQTVEGQVAYTYAPADDQKVSKLLSATVNGQDVDVLDPAAGKLNDRRGTSSPYIYGGLRGFELHPPQAAGLPIVTYSVVVPTRTASTIPDEFEDYLDEIGRGACARIMAIQKQDFTNLTLAAVLKKQFDEEDIPMARSDATRGFARVKMRTQASWF